MITYVYWVFVFAAAIAAIWFFGARLNRWTGALIGVAVILFTGWAAYFFYFQQLFVKRWGGVMSISVPDGRVHIAATWKDEHLWIENYDPATNTTTTASRAGVNHTSFGNSNPSV